MKNPPTVESVLLAINDGSYHARCQALRDLCPCRNNQNREVDVWREIFAKLLHGGHRERDHAAHVVGTLLDRAGRESVWRGILQQLGDELDAVMSDVRASRMLLGQMKKHGHAHRGAAMQGYRQRRRVLELQTPKDLADWLNALDDVQGRAPVAVSHPGIGRLLRWQQHRVRFQPERRLPEKDLLRMARRYLPDVFSG